MIHIAAFSGGKDSTALVLWLREQGIEFTAAFADTGWEHPLTYGYLDYINEVVLGGKLVKIKNPKFDGFTDLTIKRGMFPRQFARFCTEQLKLVPMHTFLGSLDDDVTLYQGIRAQESAHRASQPREQWDDNAGGYWIKRPLFDWTAEQVFEMHRKNNIEPNPLYKLGAGRVGCWPCIFVNQRELKAYMKTTPEIKDRLIDIERKLNDAVQAKNPGAAYRNFFHRDFIPQSWRSVTVIKHDETFKVPTADDVFRYFEQDDAQLGLLDDTPSRCMSIYNLCE